MPDIVEAVVLGLVQGLTEFLPVSSSGHLVVVPALAGWDKPSLSFDLLLHVGTLLAVVVYFRDDLARLVRGVFDHGDEPDEIDDARRLLLCLVVGTLPAAVLGLAFKDAFEDLFEKPLWVCLFWVVTAAILAAGEWIHRRAPGRQLTLRIALAVGAAQAMALTPGISRSGATIAAGIALGLPRTEAARFSFLLSVPAIAGAVVTAIPDVTSGSLDLGGATLAGFTVAAVTGYVAVAGLLRLVRTRSLLPFALYLVAVAPAAGVAL